MKFKLIIFILIILVAAGIGVFFIGTKENEDNSEKNREKVLSQLYLAIEDAEKMGKYKCCLEPPCTMCYLGDWIWKDGTCDCDGMIAMNEWDKVCPQCVKGLKEGKCKSEIGTCPIL
jgi:hypothetical protein